MTNALQARLCAWMMALNALLYLLTYLLHSVGRLTYYTSGQRQAGQLPDQVLVTVLDAEAGWGKPIPSRMLCLS